MERIFNFSAGPATLPLEVLEEIKADFLNYKGCGMSVMEMSHRGKDYAKIIDDTENSIKRILKLKDNYKVLFLTGGASTQFALIPMNILRDGKSADYINTGTWSKKAIKEVQIQKKNVNIIASSEDKNFSYIPKEYTINSDAEYLHITSNNTISGTQWVNYPQTNIPLVCDMSSDMLSTAMDFNKFALIYAGAQKNIGPAGVTLVVIREDLLERVPADLPTMFKYTTHVEKGSMFNTPPTFPIYVLGLVMKWVEKLGGVKEIEKLNRTKSDLLYNKIDSADYYRGTVEKDSRSIMNVTFRLPNEDLEAKFIKEAAEKGLSGLKGHRSVGGCRASIYNAMPFEGVKALVDFMSEFEKNNG